LRKARSEARSISFMDLEAPRDEVLAQKDQANTVFLLHGSGLADMGSLSAGLRGLASITGVANFKGAKKFGEAGVEGFHWHLVKLLFG